MIGDPTMPLSTTRRRPARRRLALALAAAAATLAVTACGGGDDTDGGAGGESSEPLTFWTLESEPNRVARTEANLERFTEQTGIEVDLVTVEETAVPQQMITNAASGTLPDVVDHPMVMTSRWLGDGLLDGEAAQEVVDELDPATFREAGLEFAAVDGEVAAVPTSGWGLIMHYRKDWFDAAGLEPPTSFENILAAAQALHDPENDRYGIVLGNDPGHQVTQQIFEHFALGNGCQLIGEDDRLALEDERCVETFEFYDELLKNHSPAGTFNSVDQRAVYLAGQAAMMPQGPFTLHRLAGLEDAELANCPECTAEPGYLAANTGLVSQIEGYHGDTAQYGRISNLGITVDADTENAQELVKYLLGDGYTEWLAQVPNGMIPMRTGTPEEPEMFVDAWQELNMGVDREGTLVEYYGEDTVAALVDGAQNFDAWGIQQGFGELVGVLYELTTIPAAVGEVQNGVLTPEEAAADVQQKLSDELELIESAG
ncbi:extracellular solute-binding protein [Jiangella aurantiaca]|uniref:Extracellular solute-binding protein n=2 Tax=Jiangella aurantiaca TaxID=2530373 RepID=A0A4R5A2H1_9ACTN|nr:extracellular solute-binding protein [Jiangella aurantiaca]